MYYDYIKKSVNSLVVMNNGKIVKANKIQTYEDPREKRMEGIYNGKPFTYIQKKPKFSLFPEKHVSFSSNVLSSPPSGNISYKKRTPTPYPRDRKNKKGISQHKRKPKNKNITKTKKRKL